MITIKNLIDATPELRQLYDTSENFRGVVDNAPEGAGVAGALLVLGAALEQNSGESRGLADDPALRNFDSGAGRTLHNPGVGSGNMAQAPMHPPEGLGGGVVGLSNPAVGNDSGEEDAEAAAEEGPKQHHRI